MAKDPFGGCCFPGCETPCFAPIDLFCPFHLRAVPAEITHTLELELRQHSPDLTHWRALLDKARLAVVAQAAAARV